jgi:hypothetical protein
MILLNCRASKRIVAFYDHEDTGQRESDLRHLCDGRSRDSTALYEQTKEIPHLFPKINVPR